MWRFQSNLKGNTVTKKHYIYPVSVSQGNPSHSQVFFPVDFSKPPLMELEHVLKLIDSFWFEFNILDQKNQNPLISQTSHPNPDHQIEEQSIEPMFCGIQSIHTRSMSDQLSSISSFKDDPISPDSVLLRPKLQTILSGKEVTDQESENPTLTNHKVAFQAKKNVGKIKGKKRETKSLSDLEFEELKGFMDLGFVFSEEDKDSSLASIIPGLQRLGKKDKEKETKNCDEYYGVARPYLSEAWEVLDRREKEENPLVNWTITAFNSDIDIKDSLRWWAHTVASTVR